jgi:hypothetical protein
MHWWCGGQNLGNSGPYVKPQPLHDMQREIKPVSDVRHATLYMMKASAECSSVYIKHQL